MSGGLGRLLAKRMPFHPLFVHFPIAILLAAHAVDLISAARPSHGAIRDSATWLYCLGATMAMAAYFSGLEAASDLRVSADAANALTWHFTWADRTTWYFVYFASIRLAMSYIWQSRTRRMMITSVLLALAGLCLLATAADHGGRLVFRHGLGVSSVPSGKSIWRTPGESRRLAEDNTRTQ